MAALFGEWLLSAIVQLLGEILSSAPDPPWGSHGQRSRQVSPLVMWNAVFISIFGLALLVLLAVVTVHIFGLLEEILRSGTAG